MGLELQLQRKAIAHSALWHQSLNVDIYNDLYLYSFNVPTLSTED